LIATEIGLWRMTQKNILEKNSHWFKTKKAIKKFQRNSFHRKTDFRIAKSKNWFLGKIEQMIKEWIEYTEMRAVNLKFNSSFRLSTGNGISKTLFSMSVCLAIFSKSARYQRK
jgi:hypothetical protein